jgi:hypothetical protein
MSLASKLDYRYIYVLGNLAFPFRYKIGIAKSVEKRKAGIDRSLSGKTFDIFWIKVMFAHQIEGFLHGLYSPLHARMSGSGYTEWFWMIFPVTPILLLIIVWAIEILLIPAAIVALIYGLFNFLSL